MRTRTPGREELAVKESRQSSKGGQRRRDCEPDNNAGTSRALAWEECGEWDCEMGVERMGREGA